MPGLIHLICFNKKSSPFHGSCEPGLIIAIIAWPSRRYIASVTFWGVKAR